MMMFAAVGSQVAAVAVLAMLAGVVFDWNSACDLALGGFTAIVPNGLFALRLAMHRNRAPESYPVVFFLGEFMKIGLTAGLLALVVRNVADLQWLALLVGLIVALKAPLVWGMWFLRVPSSGQGGAQESVR
jgi:ATP synthase protein I